MTVDEQLIVTNNGTAGLTLLTFLAPVFPPTQPAERPNHHRSNECSRSQSGCSQGGEEWLLTLRRVREEP